MSWEATAFGLLALALLAGFAWYERSRPPSQVVAMVAALAALSVAGRLALDPVPNVAPTTDITLITGYALGGPPGFAVGALSALVSNFWLGQGPWTPWQMAGWGLCGLFGAWLALVTGRRLGRFGLAAACGVAGLAYGALLDLSVMTTWGGEQSLDRYLALSARGIPFNLAHAAGNFAMALVAGPALVRMLGRFRTRFEGRWASPASGEEPSAPGDGEPVPPPAADPVPSGRRSRPVSGGVAMALLAALATVALGWPQGSSGRAGAVRVAGGAAVGSAAAPAAGGASARAADGRARALAWLQRAQNRDGGFGVASGSGSSAGMTGWAALGLEGAGLNPLDLRRAGGTPISYLRRSAGAIRTTGDIERTILLLRGAGLDPRGFRGQDLVARLRARRSRDGSFARQVNLTAFGALALKAAGAPGAGRAAAWLRRAQNADGGWGFSTAASSDADSTGAALQALAASGGARGAIRRGVSYLRGSQRASGGWELQGGSVNAQSTAWAVQGLLAAGVAPRSVRRGGRSPVGYLASLQAHDGHYRYSASSDQTPVWVTAQAMMAVGGEAFPVEPVARNAGGAVRGGPGGSARAPAAAGAGEVASAAGGATAARGGRGGEAASASPGAAPGSADREAAAGRADPIAADGEPASARTAAEGTDATTPIVLGGMAVLLAALGAGWFGYRRRLP